MQKRSINDILVAFYMAQVSRALKRAMLQLCPSTVRDSLLSSFPNLRKASPAGRRLLFEQYYGNIRVNVDTRYRVERIMWSGIYEPSLFHFLEATGISGWICVDIGANVGAVTLALAKLVGAQGRVYAIEPGPPNLLRLRANCELNPELTARLEIVAAGAGAEEGELWWAEESGNPGNALLGSQGSHRIPVITLDEFVLKRGMNRLDFIKIDVEGMELEVLKGAEHTLQRFHPVLYFETLPRYSTRHGGSSFEQIREFLVDTFGYSLFSIDRTNRLRPVSKHRFGDYTVAVHADTSASCLP